jgi:hypothetical protein
MLAVLIDQDDERAALFVERIAQVSGSDFG